MNSIFNFSKAMTGLPENTDIGRRIGTLMRNMLLLENPQFFPNDYEIMSKWPTSE